MTDDFLNLLNQPKKQIIMNNIKDVFTIQHLENISAVKAHTIRIWEKRYGLFSPTRASRNVRYYDLNSLKKLLNITLLLGKGMKISKLQI